jgi:hypothetical protein
VDDPGLESADAKLGLEPLIQFALVAAPREANTNGRSTIFGWAAMISMGGNGNVPALPFSPFSVRITQTPSTTLASARQSRSLRCSNGAQFDGLRPI